MATPASSLARGWIATSSTREPGLDDRPEHRGPDAGSVRTRTDHGHRCRAAATVARDRASAWNSRASARAVDSSVAPVARVSTTVPRSKLRWLGKPASEKTVSIAWFSASTSASNDVIPRDLANAARCSRSRVPTPSPRAPSATRKAISERRRSHRLGGAESDQLALALRDERQRLGVRQHMVDVGVRGVPRDAEEPEPDRLVRDLRVELVQLRTVVAAQWPDHGDRPIRQQDVRRARDRRSSPHRTYLSPGEGCPVEPDLTAPVAVRPRPDSRPVANASWRIGHHLTRTPGDDAPSGPVLVVDEIDFEQQLGALCVPGENPGRATSGSRSHQRARRSSPARSRAAPGSPARPGRSVPPRSSRSHSARSRSRRAGME